MSQTTPPLGGRYELRRQLAAGPAARVYLAQDLELGRPVAVKVLGPDLARDPEVVERFRQAANTAASVHDPRIVTIYDWGDDQGAVYVAMELVDGPSLAQTLQDAQRLGVDRIVNIGIGVAQALDAAHRAGLVHGSLTPRDVLLARDGTVKVTDFGTATAGLAALGDPTANALYQAPEQLQGGPPDARSDLYALGVILYEAATGSPPFRGPDVVSITQRKLSDRAIPPSTATTGIPPGFDAVVERLLDRDPARRYDSGAAAAADLLRLGETIQVPLATATAPLPTVAAPVPPLASAPLGDTPRQDEKKRSATGWIVAAIIILVLAVGGLVAWAVTQDDKDKAKQVLVPAVVGRTLPQAEAAIQDAGLSSSTVNEANDEFGPGIVFDQAPQPATNASRGSVVVLKVSSGPTPTTTSSTTTTTTPSTTTTTSSTTTTTTTLPETTTST